MCEKFRGQTHAHICTHACTHMHMHRERDDREREMTEREKESWGGERVGERREKERDRGYINQHTLFNLK